ncbi:hypothetical protein CSUI_008206, partial [Cystoisospora suis]
TRSDPPYYSEKTYRTAYRDFSIRENRERREADEKEREERRKIKEREKRRKIKERVESKHQGGREDRVLQALRSIVLHQTGGSQRQAGRDLSEKKEELHGEVKEDEDQEEEVEPKESQRETEARRRKKRRRKDRKREQTMMLQEDKEGLSQNACISSKNDTIEDIEGLKHVTEAEEKDFEEKRREKEEGEKDSCLHTEASSVSSTLTRQPGWQNSSHRNMRNSSISHSLLATPKTIDPLESIDASETIDPSGCLSIDTAASVFQLNACNRSVPSSLQISPQLIAENTRRIDAPLTSKKDSVRNVSPHTSHDRTAFSLHGSPAASTEEKRLVEKNQGEVRDHKASIEGNSQGSEKTCKSMSIDEEEEVKEMQQKTEEKNNPQRETRQEKLKEEERQEEKDARDIDTERIREHPQEEEEREEKKMVEKMKMTDKIREKTEQEEETGTRSSTSFSSPVEVCEGTQLKGSFWRRTRNLIEKFEKRKAIISKCTDKERREVAPHLDQQEEKEETGEKEKEEGKVEEEEDKDRSSCIERQRKQGKKRRRGKKKRPREAFGREDNKGQKEV